MAITHPEPAQHAPMLHREIIIVRLSNIVQYNFAVMQETNLKSRGA